jgi:Txe/YoeB family toxin of Txe-Axe toxin-antitoxin module
MRSAEQKSAAESCPQKTLGWQDHLWWQGQDRKTLRRINTLIKDRPQRAMGRTEDLRRSCP